MTRSDWLWLAVVMCVIKGAEAQSVSAHVVFHALMLTIINTDYSLPPHGIFCCIFEYSAENDHS